MSSSNGGSTPMIAPNHFPQRLASRGFTGHVTQVTGKTVEYIVPPVCQVPAGAFLMGSDPKRDKNTYDDEKPQHSITLPTYFIARHPVTVAEYACFVRAKQQESKDWQSQKTPSGWQAQLGKLDHPVVYVTWRDALAYTKWLAERTGKPWRLPSEAEWEKAARSTDARLYPWGDTFDKTRCNTLGSGNRGTSAVGAYPNGVSPYGALGLWDMAGNVWEWTSSLYKPYPYNVADGRENLNSTGNRVLRGGSWGNSARDARAAFRYYVYLPGILGNDIGFRVVLGAPIS